MRGLPLSPFVCATLRLCAAFSLNRALLFFSCPGSRYCLTKYFMAQSTPYLPTVSYSLSRNKGFVLRRWGRQGSRVILLFLF